MTGIGEEEPGGLAWGEGSVGQVIARPHRRFRKNPPLWYEEMHAREKRAHSSRRIRVEHGIAHLKNWRTLARHHERREQLPETIQARPTTRHGQPCTSS